MEKQQTKAQPLGQPFWDELADAESVLVAGCGGGYDVFSGLPLFLALHRAGKRVHLASLSFTRGLDSVTGRRITDICVEVTADSTRGRTWTRTLRTFSNCRLITSCACDACEQWVTRPRTIPTFPSCIFPFGFASI